jgi:glycosyltransferase involved in cell wall biosynthesis
VKIAHITVYPTEGQKHVKASGVASYAKNLISTMPVADNDEVFVLCNMIDGQRQTYSENGVQVIRCFSRSPRFMIELLQELRRINPDVLHIQQELALFGNIVTAYLLQWFVLLSRKYQPVLTLHGVVDPQKINAAFIKENNAKLPVWLVKLAFWLIFKPLTMWAKRVVVHEQYFKNILVQRYNVAAKKIAVIAHGVEALQPTAKSQACRDLDLDASANLILFMGYLTGYKGLDLLIEGFSSYAKEDPRAFLVIGAGEHPKLADDPVYMREYKRLQQKAQKLLPAQQYRWAGFIPEQKINHYYSACDVSVYPYTVSMASSGPMSFAIGFEKPFLASDAFADIFDSNLLFERSPKALSKKLQYFFVHTDAFKTQLRQLKQSRSWHHVSEQTYQLYEQVAK